MERAVTRRQGPRCEPVKMHDGSVVLARLKPGTELTDEDRKALADFHQFLKDEHARREAAGDGV